MPSIRSNRVVIGPEMRPATVHVDQGVVVAIDDSSADRDFGDLVILPGLVDTHVHVNEPGRADWEGFATATKAAIAGGTTTIVDMPLNSIPPTVDVAALDEKRRSASGRIVGDVAFWGGVIPGSQSQVGALEDAGVCGFKVFMTDSGVPEFPPLDKLDGLMLNTPLLVHAEADPELSRPADGSYAAYLGSRPPAAEVRAIEELHGLQGRVHVLHVSSGDAVEAVLAGPSSLSGETCPHYLTFCAEEVPPGATEYKCAPPIRGREHREALWEGLRSGALSMVVSDHSPSPPELKQGDFATAWGGISSVQLRLLATWTGAAERGIDLVHLVTWLALEPARLAGLDDRKGSIEVGKDADFVVFDPDSVTVVVGSELSHRHSLTPYEGMRLRGQVVDTMLGSAAKMLVR